MLIHVPLALVSFRSIGVLPPQKRQWLLIKALALAEGTPLLHRLRNIQVWFEKCVPLKN